jgi:hypothetical protein
MEKVNENLAEMRKALADVNTSSEDLTTVERVMRGCITS